MTKRVDQVQAVFERYIALSSEQRIIFAAQVRGYNRGASTALDPEPRNKAGRPIGAKNKQKTANGAEAPAEGAQV